MTPFLPYFDDEFYRLTKIKNLGPLGEVQRGAGKEVLQTKPGGKYGRKLKWIFSN